MLLLCYHFQELAKQIDDYTGTYEPEDQMEWNLVLGEIKAFIEVSKCFLDIFWERLKHL